MATHLLKARASDLTTMTAGFPMTASSGPTNAQVAAQLALLSSLGGWPQAQPQSAYIPSTPKEQVSPQGSLVLQLAQKAPVPQDKPTAGIRDPSTVVTMPASVSPPLSPPAELEHEGSTDSLHLLARLAVLKQKQAVPEATKKASAVGAVGKPLAPPPPLGSLVSSLPQQTSKKHSYCLAMRVNSKHHSAAAPLPPPPPGLSNVIPADKNIQAVLSRKSQAHSSALATPQVAQGKMTPASLSELVGGGGVTARKTNRVQFPEKLHQILKDLDQQGRDDIVSFVNNGAAFQIHQPETFEREIIPKYFSGQQKGGLGSFKRQLHLYGFQRIKNDRRSSPPGFPIALVFCHPHFLKGQPKLCLRMERVNKRKQHKERERRQLLIHAKQGSS